MKRIGVLGLAIWFVLIMAPLSCLAADNQLVSRLCSLDRHQRVQEGYELATAHMSQYAGTPAFDYVYGSLALKANHPEVAVFAFQRILMLNPHHQAALFGLATSYFELDDWANAKETFRLLLSLNPPNKMRVLAQKFLQEIKLKEKKRRTLVTGSFRVDSGYDSNANLAPILSLIAVPGTGIIPLGEAAQSIPSYYNNYAASISAIHTFNSEYAIYGLVNGFHRDNYQAKNFNYTILRQVGGLAIKKGEWRFVVPVEVQQFFLSDKIYRHAFISAIEVGHPVGSNFFSIMLGSRYLRYPKRNFRNSRYFTVIGSWVATPRSIPLVTATRLYYTDGSAKDPLNADLIRDYYGAQFLMRWNGFLNQTPFLSVIYLHNLYNASHILFLQKRVDNLFDLVVGWRFLIGKNWSLIPSYSYTNNKSNLPAFSYRRSIYQVGLQYDFNFDNK